MFELDFSGRIGIASYWKGYIALLLMTSFTAGLVGFNMVYGMLSGGFVTDLLQVLVGLSVLVWLMLELLALSWIVRRARDAGNTLWFSVLALVVPFGGIVIGVLPSKS